MSDTDLRSLLRWLSDHDPPQAMVLSCNHAPAPRVRRSMVGVRINSCLATCSVDLVIQVLASGAGKILITDCDLDPQGVAERVETWSQLLPGLVRTVASCEIRPRWPHRAGISLDLGRVPLPRREILGLGAVDQMRTHVAEKLDLSDDCAGRTIQALRLLRSQGRLSSASVEDPAHIVAFTKNTTHMRDTRTSTDGQRRLTNSTTGDGMATTADQGQTCQDQVEQTVPSTQEFSRSQSKMGVDPQFPTVGVTLTTEGCVACGVCVQACPTGALQMHIVGGISELFQDGDLCRGQRKCVELCPHDVLKATGTADAAQVAEAPVTTLAQVDVVVCPKCQAPHPASEGSLCKLCAFRQRSPFGSVLPPGVPLHQI